MVVVMVVLVIVVLVSTTTSGCDNVGGGNGIDVVGGGDNDSVSECVFNVDDVVSNPRFMCV